MNILSLGLLVIWIYFLSVFKRAKTDYFYYLCGSIGLFIFMMVMIQPILTEPLMTLVTSISGLLGKITGFYTAYQDYNILFIENSGRQVAISLYVDFECSGIIEMLAFVSLLAFFQVYDILQRVIISVLSCIYIFLANVIRIFFICMMIYYGGNDMYYIAHTIVGRIVFYFLSILLYYYVFTHAQIVKQRIGGFGYTNHD